MWQAIRKFFSDIRPMSEQDRMMRCLSEACDLAHLEFLEKKWLRKEWRQR